MAQTIMYNEEEFEELFSDSFRRADELHNGDGFLDSLGYGLVMREMGFNPSESDLKDVDTDGNGLIDREELRVYLMKRREQLPSPEELEIKLREAFAELDEDNNGYISSDELKKHLSNHGEKWTDEECNELIQEADLDQDGHVDIGEFIARMMTCLIPIPLGKS
ncbi:calmodulin-B-like [Argopecten irradians]|uniref:calmodulin-B-like n=1 Tax=Argopecten irradians TaxID=31199 RepID=UPI003713079F